MAADKDNSQIVMFCPKCKSINVSTDTSFNPLVSVGGMYPFYVCNSCGYSGQVFPESKKGNLLKLSRMPHFKKKIQPDENIVDTRYGDFYAKVIFKVLAPIFVAVGIYLAVFGNTSGGIFFLAAGSFMFYSIYVLQRTQ